MATGKTLSKGTLGLRFMQNAQRVKQQPTSELDRAKVKDDAEWEVAKEIREAWGLASSSSSTESENKVSHEPSYLPFLFPVLHETGSPSSDGSAAISTTSSKFSGRRKFAKGKEVVSAQSSADDPAIVDIKREDAAAANSHAEPSSEPAETRYKQGAGPLTKKRARKLAELDRAGILPPGETSSSDVPVLTMISGETSAAVGMDMRQIRKLKAKGSTPIVTNDDAELTAVDRRSTVNSNGKRPSIFLRPAGIDSPTPSSNSGRTNRKHERDIEGEECTDPGSTLKKTDSLSVSGSVASESQASKKRRKQKKGEPGHTIANS